MTVLVPKGKISWKCSIPIILVLVSLATAVWLLPVPDEFKSPFLTVTKYVGIIGIVVFILGTIIWTIWGNVEEEVE